MPLKHEKKINKHVSKPLKHGNDKVNVLSKPYKLCLTKFNGEKKIKVLET
jgi:hypothetical protein